MFLFSAWEATHLGGAIVYHHSAFLPPALFRSELHRFQSRGNAGVSASAASSAASEASAKQPPTSTAPLKTVASVPDFVAAAAANEPLAYASAAFASAPREMWLAWGPAEFVAVPALADGILAVQRLGAKSTEHVNENLDACARQLTVRTAQYLKWAETRLGSADAGTSGGGRSE